MASPSPDQIQALKTPGATFFLRCTLCGELYEARYGVSLLDGSLIPVWSLPPVQPRAPRAGDRAARPCKHTGGAQWWDGTTWQDAGGAPGVAT